MEWWELDDSKGEVGLSSRQRLLGMKAGLVLLSLASCQEMPGTQVFM